MDSTRVLYGLLTLTMAAWGGTFVAGRLVAFECPPFTAAFWRFFVAAAVLVPILWWKEKKIIPPKLPFRVWLGLAGLGATGMFGYNYFFIEGLGLLEAGRASIIVAINPCLTYLGAALLFKEKLTNRGLIGFGLALLGAMTAITHGQPLSILSGGLGAGELLIFGCVICWATYSLLGQVVLAHLSPLMSTVWAILFGLLFLAPATLLESGWPDFSTFSSTVWYSLLFLGVVGTALGFTFYYQGLARLGAGRTVIFINLVPVFGLFFGWLLLGESVDWSLGAGLLLVLGGIRLIQHRSR